MCFSFTFYRFNSLALYLRVSSSVPRVSVVPDNKTTLQRINYTQSGKRYFSATNVILHCVPKNVHLLFFQ